MAMIDSLMVLSTCRDEKESSRSVSTTSSPTVNEEDHEYKAMRRTHPRVILYRYIIITFIPKLIRHNNVHSFNQPILIINQSKTLAGFRFLRSISGPVHQTWLPPSSSSRRSETLPPLDFRLLLFSSSSSSRWTNNSSKRGHLPPTSLVGLEVGAAEGFLVGCFVGAREGEDVGWSAVQSPRLHPPR